MINDTFCILNKFMRDSHEEHLSGSVKPLLVYGKAYLFEQIAEFIRGVIFSRRRVQKRAKSYIIIEFFELSYQDL